jgi:orotate phosphoribosyltransferase
LATLWADKEDDDFAFKRAGFTSQLTDKRVLVVEDLLTTGSSVRKVCRQAERYGADIVGVSVVCNRGGVTASDLGVRRLAAIANVNFEKFDPDACPLCEQQIPIVEDIGHGDKYKLEHPDYPGSYVKLLS